MKRFRMFFGLLCYAYLLVVFSIVNSTEHNARITREIKELVEGNIKIKEKYEEERRERFIISEDLADRRRQFIHKTIEVAESQKDLKTDEDFTNKIYRLRKWYEFLDSARTKKKEYEIFLQEASKEIMELKKKQLKGWLQIKRALQEQEAQQPKNRVAGVRMAEEQKWFEIYNKFIYELGQFLLTNSILAKDQDSLRNLMQKYSQHGLNAGKETSQKKAEVYTQIIVCCLLREHIIILFQRIDSTKYDVVEAPDFNLGKSISWQDLFYAAIKLEEEEYSAKNAFREGGRIFSSIIPYIKKEVDYNIIQNVLETKTQKVRKLIKNRYRDIGKKIEEICKNNTNLGETFAENFQDKIDLLVEHNDSAIDAVLRSIESGSYIKQLDNNKNRLFSLHSSNKIEISLAADQISKTAVIEWFEIPFDLSGYKRVGTESPKTSAISAEKHLFNLKEKELVLGNTSKWANNMQEEEPEKNKTLLKLGKVLENINAIFSMLSEVLVKELDPKEHSDLARKIRIVGELSTALCYTAKLKELQRAGKWEVPPYTLFVVKLILKIENNRCKEHPVLNEKNYFKINTITPYAFFLNEESAHRILKYLQTLIKECTEETEKLGFLLEPSKQKRHHVLARNLCSVDVQKHLKPSKSLPLTEKVYTRIKRVVNSIAEEIEKTKRIKSRAEFYSIRNNLIMFDGAVKILELYILHTDKKVIDALTAYKEDNTVKTLRLIAQKERSKEVQKSKIAAIESEKIIADANDEVPQLLSEIGSTEVSKLNKTLVNSESSEFASKSMSHTPAAKEERARTPFSINAYIIDIVAVGGVCIIGIALEMYFCFKEKQMLNNPKIK